MIERALETLRLLVRHAGWFLGRRGRAGRGFGEGAGHLELGRLGEQAAATHLESTGHRVLARNRRIHGVEIDIVAECPSTARLLVVEVKTSMGSSPPERRVGWDRRRRLVRAASSLARDRAVDIEVMTVNLPCSGRPSIRRIRLEPADLPTGAPPISGR